MCDARFVSYATDAVAVRFPTIVTMRSKLVSAYVYLVAVFVPEKLNRRGMRLPTSTRIPCQLLKVGFPRGGLVSLKITDFLRTKIADDTCIQV